MTKKPPEKLRTNVVNMYTPYSIVCLLLSIDMVEAVMCRSRRGVGELSSVLLRREQGAVLTLGIGYIMKQCPQLHVVISTVSQAGDELLIHSNQYWFVVHL